MKKIEDWFLYSFFKIIWAGFAFVFELGHWILKKTYKSNFLWFSIFFGVILCAWHFDLKKILNERIAPFMIQKIEFDGNDHVADILLLKASGLRYKSNIFNCSVENVKNRLEKIAWVRSAMVQRRLPDRICVRIVERVPIAILQMNRKLYLVDKDGQVLDHDGIGSFDNLPLVVGDGAGQNAPSLLSYLDKFPKFRKQLVYATFVGNRRWDMKLSRNVDVKLPEKGLFHALSILDELSNSDGLFKDNIDVIDLRLLDRVVITNKEKKK